jgi:hypothetical protein
MLCSSHGHSALPVLALGAPASARALPVLALGASALVARVHGYFA